MLKRLLFISSFAICLSAHAQKGQYIQVWGGFQSTQIDNAQESYYGSSSLESVNLVETDRPVFGIDYFWNFHNYFGLQTGLIYSMQGQKYNGFIIHDANDPTGHNPADSNINYTSQVLLNYIKVPFLFRFNSGKEETSIVDVSIFAGFQIAYLADVQDISSNPAPPANLTQDPIDFRKFYKPLDFEWTAGLQVNIFVSQYWGIAIGARYDRSLEDMESKDIVYDKNRIYPAEWYYPISVKKVSTPSQDDQYDRFSSKNNSVGAFIGIFVPIGK